MAKSNFFSTLSVDELVAIVQQPTFDGDRFLNFWIKGPFVRAMPHVFRHILLGMGDNPFADSRSGTIRVGMETDVRSVYLASGPVFQTISVDPNCFPLHVREDLDNLPLLLQKDACLVMNATGFECPESKFNRDPFLEKMGQWCTAVKIIWSRHCNEKDIPVHMLKSFYPWRNLKSFKYSGKNPDALVTLWDKLPALTHLDIAFRGENNVSGQWRNLLGSVSIHCRNLNTIIFNGISKDPKLSNNDIAQFFSSYGEQLVDASLSILTSDNLELISKFCRNMRCSFYESRGHFGRIESLGRLIRKLYLSIPRTATIELIVAAFRECTELEDFTLEVRNHEVSADLFASLFSTGMDKVKRLIIITPLSQAHLQLISKHLKHLEELRLFGIRKTCFRVFLSIIEANPKLKTFYVVESCKLANESASTMPDNNMDVFLKVLKTKKIKFSAKFRDGKVIVEG